MPGVMCFYYQTRYMKVEMLKTSYLSGLLGVIVLVLSSQNATLSRSGKSARDILINQPDFMGEQIISDYEIAIEGGFSASSKVAKKGETYRSDNGTFIFFSKPRQPTLRLDPNDKTYDELPEEEYDRRLWHVGADEVQTFARNREVEFEIAGTEKVDGRECVKIKATPKTQSVKDEGAAYFYAAKNLRNLVIKVEIQTPGRVTVYSLKNISFKVPGKLFIMPADYKRSRT